MRTLTLVRHAKSSWDAAGLADFERPLNDRGRRDAPAMGARLKKAGLRPDRLVSSPALRAITTAREFAAQFGIAVENVQVESRIYEASAARLLDVVRGLPDASRDAMLFGHNPGISEFAHQLADCPFEEMPTCAAVRIELRAQRWAEVAPGGGRVARYDFPKQHRG